MVSIMTHPLVLQSFQCHPCPCVIALLRTVFYLDAGLSSDSDSVCSETLNLDHKFGSVSCGISTVYLCWAFSIASVVHLTSVCLLWWKNGWLKQESLYTQTGLRILITMWESKYTVVAGLRVSLNVALILLSVTTDTIKCQCAVCYWCLQNWQSKNTCP